MIDEDGTNSWLNVLLAEYEGRMSSAEVQQLEAPWDLFAIALDFLRPVGVAPGNGLDPVDPEKIRGVVGIEIHPGYLDAVLQRYSDRLPGLELHRADRAKEVLTLEAVELVHAALVFERAGVGRCLDNTLALVAQMASASCNGN